MKTPRVWGDQGRRAVKPEHFEEYGRQNGLFFLKAGCVMAVIGALDALVTLDALLYLLLYVFGFAFAFYPLTRWCVAPRQEREKAHQGAAQGAGTAGEKVNPLSQILRICQLPRKGELFLLRVTLPRCQEARPSGELSSGARLRGFHRTQAVFFVPVQRGESGTI